MGMGGCCLTPIVVGIAVFFGCVAYLVSVQTTKSPQGKAQYKSLLIGIATGIGVIFLACGGLWLASWASPIGTSPSEEPAREDIVGLWALTPSSEEFMKQEGGYIVSTHTLAFKDNGTFVMTNMPDWWLFDNYGKSRGGFVSGNGTWEIYQNTNGYWEIIVLVSSLTSHPNGLGTHFHLGGRKPPYLIYTYIDDPDTGRVMVFERQ